MKSCAYCGRENLDHATSCYECGTDEFVMQAPPATKELAEVAVETPAAALVEPANDQDAERRAEREREYLKTDLPADHFLLTSTDEELVEILARPSDWGGFHVAHARRLVFQRGIDLKRVEEKKAENVRRLQRGQRASKKLIVFGWIFSVMGGVIGLGIAWSLISMKEKTPHGEFFTYDEESRVIGRKMLNVAGVMFAFGVIMRLISLLLR
jgi:hypothetical protein